MRDRGKTKQELKDTATLGPPKDQPDRLLEVYGDHIADQDLNDAQKKELLMALWQIMVAFVDLGFSMKSGDKLFLESDASFDDVLDYICLEDPARETVASPDNKQEEERA